MDRVPIVRLHRMGWWPLIGILMDATASLAIVSPGRAGAITPAAFTNLSILGASPAFETSRQVLAAGFNEATYAGPLGPHGFLWKSVWPGFAGRSRTGNDAADLRPYRVCDDVLQNRRFPSAPTRYRLF
jgi:hypothetical protein